MGKGAFKYYVSTFGGGGGSEPKCWYCWRFGGGWGGLSQNADMLTLGRERVGEFKHRASICGQILEVINKLMNFFLNHALISLNTPQNIFLTIIEKYILIIWNISWKSSSNSPSVQVLRQQIRGGGGSRLVLILLTQGGGGGPKSGKSCWRNTWMLPYLSSKKLAATYWAVAG